MTTKFLTTLWTTATFLGSLGWSLYSGLTVNPNLKCVFLQTHLLKVWPGLICKIHWPISVL
jgi:hypothetical protein